MAAKLVAEEGVLKGLVLTLEDGDQWVIGRDPDACQLLVEDPSASRKHLICRATPNGIVVENLSETNPVEVNEKKVKEPRLLHNGDTVKIGDGIFRFYAEAAARLYKNSGEEKFKNQNRHLMDNLEMNQTKMKQKTKLTNTKLKLPP
jgi:pSer/pThr/pTyr-binding forkhead associated (FHA) protein